MGTEANTPCSKGTLKTGFPLNLHELEVGHGHASGELAQVDWAYISAKQSLNMPDRLNISIRNKKIQMI